jgi:hypothetical protein
VGAVTGALPRGTHPGEIFLFIAVSFAAQNAIVARRTIWKNGEPSRRMVTAERRSAES